MNQELADFAVRVVATRLGIAVTVKEGWESEEEFWDFAPDGGHPNESFVIRFRPGWRGAQAQFIAGEFARELIRRMGHCSDEGRDAFVAFVRGAQAARIRTSMRVNGAEVQADDPQAWPGEWERLELSLRVPPMVLDQADTQQMKQLIQALVLPLYGMMSALIGVEEADDEALGAIEGAGRLALVTRYERKKVNREACIRLKGSKCAVCGFDFKAAYGPLGDGFIEVHHTMPVSSMGPGYHVNVIRDLEPLCANCHAMAHREDPPVVMDRLRQIVTDQRNPISGGD